GRRRLAALVATHGPAVLHLGALPRQESHALLTRVLGRQRVAAEHAAARALTDLCGHVPLALRIVMARLLTRPAQRLADCATWLRRDLPARLALPDDPRLSVPLILDGALRRLPAPLRDALLRLAPLNAQLTVPDAAGASAARRARAAGAAERAAHRARRGGRARGARDPRRGAAGTAPRPRSPRRGAARPAPDERPLPRPRAAPRHAGGRGSAGPPARGPARPAVRRHLTRPARPAAPAQPPARRTSLTSTPRPT